MRSTWLSFGFAFALPVTGLLGACGPGDETTQPTGGGGTGGTTTTTTQGGGGTTTTTTQGGGGVGGVGGDGGVGGVGGQGGQGGSGGSPENDLCPGELLGPALDETLTVKGTLDGAADDYVSFCADTDPGPGAPDVVYQIDVPATASVTVQISASGFVPALSLRKVECGTRFSGDTCLNLGAGNVSAKVSLNAGSYWVVVDSANGQTGTFDLSVTAATPKCGDGVINPGEQCDPAVPGDDDGCFNPGTPDECQFGEPPPDPAIVMCPGGLITIAKGDAFQLGPYNNGAGQNNFIGTCSPQAMGDPTPSGPENMFHIIPNADGMLTAVIGHAEDPTQLYCDVNLDDCADFIMYLRKGACESADPADELGCADYTLNPNSPFGYDELLTIEAQVKANTDYWLIVDGLDQVYGIGGYFLELKLQ